MIHLPPNITERANTIQEWLSYDSPEHYKELTDFGKNLYRPGEIEYKFNSDGFRCDEFTMLSDLPIVFLGCSCTEGIGLHLEDTWSYKLLEKIKNKTQKDIPYWSLAIGGCGIDEQARYLYWFSKLSTIKNIFGFFPPFSRREYCFENCMPTVWAPAYATNPTIERVFSDEHFISHQAARSMMIIDSITSANNANMACSNWSLDPSDHFILHNQFPNSNFFAHEILSCDSARDSMHPGPYFHTQLANKFWEKIEHRF